MLFIFLAQRSTAVFFLSSLWPFSHYCDSCKCIIVTYTAQREQQLHSNWHLLPPGCMSNTWPEGTAPSKKIFLISISNLRCINLIPRHFIKWFGLTENWEGSSSIGRSLAPVDTVITFTHHFIHTWSALKDRSAVHPAKMGKVEQVSASFSERSCKGKIPTDSTKPSRPDKHGE